MILNQQIKLWFYILVLSVITSSIHGQEFKLEAQKSFFAVSDTFNKKRFNYALGISAVTYTGFSVGLYNTWYKKFPRESFHTFDDWGEWGHMDKIGHVYTAYFQGVLCYKGAKWTGLSDSKSILVGAICATMFQTTIEVMDGFSSNWGFSVTDFSANILGIGIYAAQQKYWKEQRIMLKVSSIPRSYPDFAVIGNNGTVSNLQERADNLFGASFPEQFLKDYNAQVYWASFNVHSFLPTGNKWPQWFNLAIGYGSDNMFGGFDNEWEVDGEHFSVDRDLFPRVHQYYLGFDLDLTKVRTQSPLLKGFLSIFNIFKMPSPAIELNSRREFTFHLFR